MRTFTPLLVGLLSPALLACGGSDTSTASGGGGTQGTGNGSSASAGMGGSGGNGAGGEGNAGGSGGAGGTMLVGTSISKYAKCDGTTDDAKAVATAFDAAKHHAFTLIIDCPVLMHVGSDIARTVFIEDGTTVVFTDKGKLTVDNVLLPAFAIADSSDITLTDWNLEYTGGIPVDVKSIGYDDDGVHHDPSGDAPVGGAFNDLRITPWLTMNRQVTFDHQTSHWLGPTNTSSVFFLSGDVGSVKVTGMKAYVPDSAGGSQFIPMLFSLGVNYRTGAMAAAGDMITAENSAISHDLTFSNVSIDGFYMGWQGSCRSCTFDHITAKRYGDLQDAQGNNVGGVGKWFAPPHLFYLNYAILADEELHNKDIHVTNVTDESIRVGVARDKGGNDPGSGNALSLKIGGESCSVDHYSAKRPDGFLDTLNSDGLTISNVTASYSSQFLNNIYPGWRFPQTPYTDVTFSDVTLTDTATSTVYPPIGSANQATNAGIVLKNVKVVLNSWDGSGALAPVFAGSTNAIDVTFVEKAKKSTTVEAQKNSVTMTLQATPNSLHTGDSATLVWTSKGGTTCAAGGDWSGAVAASGTKSVSITHSGNRTVTLTCKNGNDTATATVPIVVSP